MTYKYKVINLQAEIMKVRVDENRKDEASPTIAIDILNRLGLDGWRALNLPNTNELYFERVKK